MKFSKWQQLRLKLQGVHPRFLARHMLSLEHGLILGFTHKAACTVGAKLFFHHIGRLDEALAFDPWIHKFREHYLKTHRLDASRDWKPANLKLKLVRNPYTRAVSGYTHGMAHPKLGADLNAVFGPGDPCRLSFAQYLEFLEARLRHGVNPHFGTQYMPEERRYRYDLILKVESLDAGLDELQSRFGVRLEINDRIRQSNHHRPRIEWAGSKVHDLPYLEYPRDAQGNTLIPPYHAFYNDEIRARVASLFRADLDAYGYAFDLEKSVTEKPAQMAEA